MDGRWLALGTIGALAVAGARRRGSGAKYKLPRHLARFLPFMPRMYFYCWSDRGRVCWATPNWVSAKTWTRHMENQGYKRVSAMSEPSRGVEVSGMDWLLPNGELAYDLSVRVLDPQEGLVVTLADLEIKPTLAGPKITQTDFLRVPVEMLGPDIERRLKTIALREKLGWSEALEEMTSSLCEDRAEGYAKYAHNNHLREIGWLVDHQGLRHKRGGE